MTRVKGNQLLLTVMRSFFAGGLFLTLSFSVANAVEVEIFHTNDLHGFLENSVSEKDRGGYARIKTALTRLRAESKQAGRIPLFLDAGDFLEGNIHYLANKSRYLFEIMNELGYDAVTIGNHDWLMGTTDLNQLLQETELKFDYLGANFSVNSVLYPGTKKIKDYKIIEIDGLKVGIVGLTTDELFYKWRLDFGKIKSPLKVGNEVAKKLKAQGVDFVIALTHVGLIGDKVLASLSSDIDLIVGGHSHTAIHEPVIVKNLRGQMVPIVQAGSHGKWLGDLRIKLEKGKRLRVVDYRLVPIGKQENDSKVMALVRKSQHHLYRQYGQQWLEEEIASTEVPLVSSLNEITQWSAIITDAIRESGEAHVAFHSPSLAGSDLPVGPITRKMVFNSYPRVFDMSDKFGWKVWTAEVYGVVLKMIAKAMAKTKGAVVMSGIDFELVPKKEKNRQKGLPIDPPWKSRYRVKNMKINGQKIRPFKKYRVALPEGIVVGGFGITNAVRFILHKAVQTQMPIWRVLNRKLQELKTIKKDDKYSAFGGEVSSFPVSRNKKVQRSRKYVFLPSEL